MPPAPAVFYGRDELVRDIADTILKCHTANNSANIAIVGSGGIGKTSAALAVIHQRSIVEAFGDARHWIPCDNRNTILLLLDHLARILSVTTTSGDLLGDIMSRLRQSNVPRIFLLDNLETLWDPIETKSECEAVLLLLSSLPHITVLVTMRGTMRPSGVRWTWFSPLGTLSLDAARKAAIATNPACVDEKLDELLLELDCVPLAVILVVTVGQYGFLPSELLRRLKTERTRLLEVDYDDRLKSVDYSIHLSLISTPMIYHPGALQLICILARLPGGIKPQYLQKIAPAIQDVSASERTLLRTALAYRTSEGTLQMLSPIRSHILQHYPLDDAHKVALRAFYLRLSEDGGCDPGAEGFTAASQALFLEESNARSVIMNALEDEVDTDAIHGAIHYSNYLYWNVPSTEVLDKAIDAINAHPSPELNRLMPLCLLKLGRLLSRLDRYHEAIPTLKRAEERYQNIGDWQGVAECHLMLAYIYRLLGMFQSAQRSATMAQKWFNTAGNSLGVSRALQSRARVHAGQGQVMEANIDINEAQRICMTLGDRSCAHECLRIRGIICTKLGKYDEAIALFTETQTYYLALGSRFQAAISLQNLGIAYYLQGAYNQADAALTESYDSLKALGNRGAMAWGLYFLGELGRIRGNPEEAMAFFHRAMLEFEEMGNAHEIANCLAGQARVSAANGQLEKAQDLFRNALDVLENHERYGKFITGNLEMFSHLPRPLFIPSYDTTCHNLEFFCPMLFAITTLLEHILII
jgi:tetratricopeptide (TPR) repeat protein